MGTAVASIRNMTIHRQRLGEHGESMACDELERLGYRIVARRYRSRFGEIDVVADDEGTVVFVEVKTKTDSSFGDPAEAVTLQKQRRLVSMGEDYVASHRLDDTPCRFDVVSILFGDGNPLIEVYQNAFEALC